MIRSRLLSVARASAEVTAGIPGRCAVSVRVLDDITLRIHAGELLLVQAEEPLGQAMLLTALAGRAHSPRHRYIRAVRDAVPELRIRRAALHHEAVHEIVRGWQEASVGADLAATGVVSRTVYLLRASRTGGYTPRDAAEWRQWGRHSHERRDGVVIVCPPPAIPVVHARVRSAHEPTAAYTHHGNTRHANGLRPGAASVVDRRPIRVLELRAGRLHDVRTPRDATPFDRGTTAGPAPHP
jgi:hypothetical protein